METKDLLKIYQEWIGRVGNKQIFESRNLIREDDPFRRIPLLQSRKEDVYDLFKTLLRFYFFHPSLERRLANENEIRTVFEWIIDGGDNYYRGIVFHGNIGTGKTSLMRAAKDLFYCLYGDIFGGKLPEPKYYICNDVCKIYASGAEGKIINLAKTRILCLDEVGMEPAEIKRYGSSFFPVGDVIQSRYENKRPLLVTTNLTPGQLGEKYGEAILDRLIEASVFIEMNGKSLRE